MVDLARDCAIPLSPQYQSQGQRDGPCPGSDPERHINFQPAFFHLHLFFQQGF